MFVVGSDCCVHRIGVEPSSWARRITIAEIKRPANAMKSTTLKRRRVAVGRSVFAAGASTVAVRGAPKLASFDLKASMEMVERIASPSAPPTCWWC